MSLTERAKISPVTVAIDLGVSDLRAAVVSGWHDFKT
jgi:hypothetical protein